MNEITFFIAVFSNVLVLTLIEARMDIWIIRGGRFDTEEERLEHEQGWKLWGNLHAIGWLTVAVLFVVLATHNWYALLVLPPAYIFWTLVHDAALGYWLGKGITYISDTGWDGFMKSWMIGSGAVYFGVRIFLIFLASTAYFILN